MELQLTAGSAGLAIRTASLAKTKPVIASHVMTITGLTAPFASAGMLWASFTFSTSVLSSSCKKVVSSTSLTS